jgi:ABC-type oligopeptide transport system substrate-binding subunit/class 3 adenylate cyclase
MREERKLVTALFADLVGSTALGERLDPEEAKLVVGEAIARIVHTVEGFGGTIKDLAGDGVLALFGAPAAHEDDAERALRAATGIVEEIGLYAEEVAQAWDIVGFAVRVGVSTGPVVLGPVGAGSRVEYGAVGDAVNTAARLQAAADPGGVLAGETTRRLADALFRWGEPQQLDLKGKTGAVTAYELVGAAADGRRGRGVEARLVGRDAELRTAREAVDDARAGRGGILFLTGEAGIGKSRLLTELRAHAGATADGPEPLWLEGRCLSYGESMPYWPFRDLLREWLELGADEPELRVRVALRRAVEPELYPYLGALLGLQLEPEAATRLSELAPEALQYRTFEVVETLLARLAGERPVLVALEDLHWADPTSLALVERLLGLTEGAAVLLVLTQRTERDHPAWRVKELAAREFPHRTRELPLQALSGEADRELLYALVGGDTLPDEVEARVLGAAEGNPFYLEELVRSLADAGALVREDDAWRFAHDVPAEIPPTVEKVILARIDRLPASCRDVLTAASVLGRRFGLPLLEGVADANGGLAESLHELQRLDLVREARRWPQPEYRFKHALIQEAAYRTLLASQRGVLHRKAAEWLEARYAGGEAEVLGLLAHHWLAAEDEAKAAEYLMRAGDKARQEYALDEAVGYYRELLPLLERRGERQQIALVLFKLALALHTSLRFGEANDAYRRAFEHWTPPEPYAGSVDATLRVVSTTPPNDPDPKSAIAWPNIQLCMQLFDRLVEAWPERTLVPSLAERWEISDDGLRYVFHLREGLVWSDGTPLTAADVEFGIKRVLNPESPGSSVAIYFVLENGQDYYLGRNDDADAIGVRALDDRTLEFRLVAPAPYFMSVMNRPDSGPQPRHAIERHGERWTEPENQVVSGPFRREEPLVLVRQERYAGVRPGNVARLELLNVDAPGAIPDFARDEVDMIAVRYTPRIADLMPASGDAQLGEATWTGYLKFDHSHPLVSNVDFRRALAHALDRDALAAVLSANLLVATGGLVPPAIQGHTPDIAPRFDPELAREHLARAGVAGPLAIAVFDEWREIATTIATGWREVLGLEVDLLPWSKADALGVRFDCDAPIYIHGWLPGYPDPEYFLRLLLHSDSKTNEGGFSHAPYDELIERARQERHGRARLELYHEADRMAVADRIALIPLVYGRNMAFVKPWIHGWWEFGKSSASFADLVVDR